MRTRIIGGPLHGEVKDVQKEARHLETAAFGSRKYGGYPSYGPDAYDGYMRHRYERRRIALSSLTFVEVFVLEGMTENEAHRALANVIEGV